MGKLLSMIGLATALALIGPNSYAQATNQKNIKAKAEKELVDTFVKERME